MRRAQRPQQTYSPALHRWSANLSLRPHLTSVTLANVLAGDTCDPISLSDFEGYLAYKEHSLENLQFVVWFQDYSQRFESSSVGQQVSSPKSPPEFRLSAPSRASVERRAAEGAEEASSIARRETHDSSVILPESPDDIVLQPITVSPDPVPPPPASPTIPSVPSPSGDDGEGTPRVVTPVPDLDINFTSIPGVEDQPFRLECMRVIATFLRPGARKELTLDAIVRDTAIRNLEHNTNPDVLLPIYREVYNMLESVSLRRFLIHNSSNINLPKQLFWYGVGLTDLLIGIAITVSLVTSVPTPPQGNRAWRLFGVPFVSFGAMQTYSAWRGFCTQVWGRGNVQMRVWEMQDVDEDAKAFWDQLLVELEEPSGSFTQRWDLQGSSLVRRDTTGTGNKRSPASPPPRMTRVRNGFTRPPIFGPEKVVLDPQIKAVHQKVVNEILRVGFGAAVMFAVLALCVPSRLHDFY